MQTLSLGDRLAREPQLAPREAVRIGVALARILEQEHRKGVRSSSIQPDIILLSGDSVQIADHPDGGTDPATPGTERQVFYLSPEELAGQSPDERTDVYRLGALMYHMLAGNPPPGPSPASRLPNAPRLRRIDAAPSIHTVRHDVTRTLDETIGRAMAYDPRDRFPRAGQLAEVLEESLAQRLDHQPHSDRPSQMAIVDSWEFREEELRGLRRKQRGITQRRALAVLLVLTVVLLVVLLRR